MKGYDGDSIKLGGERMTFVIETIDHIQLAAPPGGEEQARSFYGELLGFEEVEKPPLLKKNGGVWFQKGSIHVHIGIEDPFTPARKAHPAFHVQNIDGLRHMLDTRGIPVSLDGKLPGARRFYIFDPFGNRLEFLEWE